MNIYNLELNKTNDLNLYLETILNEVKFTKWYFGHYHDNMLMFNKFKLIYDEIEEIK